MENIRKHRNIKLVNNEEEYLKNVMKPNFKSGTLLEPDLMGCEMGKVRDVMNKPVYLSQAILDLSKTIMYEFHYDYMIPKYIKQNLGSDSQVQIQIQVQIHIQIHIHLTIFWTP